MKHLLFSVVLTVFLAGAPPADAARDVDQLFLEGQALYQSGGRMSAEKRFMQALTVNPRHVPSLFMMGETLSGDVGRLREAEGWYRRALREGADDRVYSTKARYSLGVLYMKMGLYDEAVEQLKTLVSTDPGFYDLPEVYNHIGVAYYHMDQHDEALMNFKTALKLDPGLLEARFNIKTLQGQLALINTARYFQRMGDDQSAANYYNKAIEAYPNYVAAWYQLGLVYLKTKDYQRAAKCLYKARALNPRYLGGREVPYQLAEAYVGRRQACDLDNALSIYNTDLAYKDSMLKAGTVCLERGVLDEAEKKLSDAAAQGDNKQSQAEAWFQLGLLYLKKGDPERAASAFQKALERVPGEKRYKNPPMNEMRRGDAPMNGQTTKDMPVLAIPAP